MTLRGLFVCLFELGLVILALGTEIKEFFVVAICVLGLILFSLLSIILASITMRVDSKINKKAIIRGDKIEYTLELYGIALLPVGAYLSLKTTEAEFNARSRKRHSFMLLPSFKLVHRFTFTVDAVHIGMWEIGIKRMRFEDVFGLFAFPLIRLGKRDFAVNLAVMPKIHHLLQNGENYSTGGFGDTNLKSSEQGDLLGDSRIYKEGDSLKRINWKQSVKTRTLYSRQYEAPQRPKAVIVVDSAVFGETVSDVADVLCETAISLANFFLSHNNIVEIAVVRAKRKDNNKSYNLVSYADIHRIQYDFAGVSFYKSDRPLKFSLTNEVEDFKADRVFVVTTNPSEELLSNFADLNKTGKTAKCFVPLTAYNNRINDDFESVRVGLSTTEQIGETVGGAI